MSVLHILQFSSTGGLAEIGDALDRTSARQLALVFPVGKDVPRADHRTLAALAERGAAEGRQITVVGGDATLRARAVAAGFDAATSLDEWPLETLPETPVAVKSDKHQRPGRSLHVLAQPEPASDGTEIEDMPDLYDPWHNDPPEYVAELIERDGTYLGPAGILGTLGTSTTCMPFAGNGQATRDADDEAAVRLAHERYEERLTARIRITSGLGSAGLGLTPPPNLLTSESGPDLGSP